MLSFPDDFWVDLMAEGLALGCRPLLGDYQGMKDHLQQLKRDISSSGSQGQEGQESPFATPVLLFQLS